MSSEFSSGRPQPYYRDGVNGFINGVSGAYYFNQRLGGARLVAPGEYGFGCQQQELWGISYIGISGYVSCDFKETTHNALFCSVSLSTWDNTPYIYVPIGANPSRGDLVTYYNWMVPFRFALNYPNYVSVISPEGLTESNTHLDVSVYGCNLPWPEWN